MAPAFIFVDPYGFKVPGALLAQLMAAGRVELFVNVIWRELDMAIQQRQPPEHGLATTLDEIFAGDGWRSIHGDTADVRMYRAMQLLSDTIGARWHTYIRMSSGRRATRYLLLHLTNHDQGRDLMKECIWRVAPDGGFEVRQRDDPKAAIAHHTQARHDALAGMVARTPAPASAYAARAQTATTIDAVASGPPEAGRRTIVEGRGHRRVRRDALAARESAALPAVRRHRRAPTRGPESRTCRDRADSAKSAHVHCSAREGGGKLLVSGGLGIQQFAARTPNRKIMWDRMLVPKSPERANSVGPVVDRQGIVAEREVLTETGLRSTARCCGHRRHRQANSVRVCSPASRRVASLRPRSAGLTALTPAPRTLVQTGSC